MKIKHFKAKTIFSFLLNKNFIKISNVIMKQDFVVMQNCIFTRDLLFIFKRGNIYLSNKMNKLIFCLGMNPQWLENNKN